MARRPFHQGLLGDAPAISLGLDPFEEELYADDVNGKPIEDLVPDYSILDHIEYEYPVTDAYFTYASRAALENVHSVASRNLKVVSVTQTR